MERTHSSPPSSPASHPASGVQPPEQVTETPDPTLPSATPRVAFGNVARGTVAQKMAVEVSVVRDPAALKALEPEWRALAASAPGALFRGPDWLLPWWDAYAPALTATPHVLVGRGNGGELVAIAPLYQRNLKIALLEARELRLMGDAGPRPPSLDLIARAGWEDRAGA